MTWQKFEDIRVWQMSREICRDIRGITGRMNPLQERGLIKQMHNSSGSIMDNIAEGFERGSNKEFKTFLGYSRGSAGELRSQLYRCLDADLTSRSEFHDLNIRLIAVSKELKVLIQYFQNNPTRGFRLSGK